MCVTTPHSNPLHVDNVEMHHSSMIRENVQQRTEKKMETRSLWFIVSDAVDRSTKAVPVIFPLW